MDKINQGVYDSLLPYCMLEKHNQSVLVAGVLLSLVVDDLKLGTVSKLPLSDM